MPPEVRDKMVSKFLERMLENMSPEEMMEQIPPEMRDKLGEAYMKEKLKEIPKRSEKIEGSTEK